MFSQNDDEAGPSASKSKFSRLQRLRDLELKMVCVHYSQNYTGNLKFLNLSNFEVKRRANNEYFKIVFSLLMLFVSKFF